MARVKFNSVFLVLFVSTLFTACFDDAVATASQRDIRGQLIDSEVSGVEYHCGTVVDFTDENGTFSCKSLPISFYIGKISLGKVLTLPSDGKVFPQDIIDVNRSDVNNSKVINLALLLQSLDKDKNASNGITITSSTRAKFTEELIVEDVNLSEIKSRLQREDENITFEDVESVVTHLRLSTGLTNSGENNNTGTNNPVTDTTAPTEPTLTTTPSFTSANTLSVVVNGEANSDVYLNDIKVGTLSSQGSLTLDLNTSGADGDKHFNIILQDASHNTSSALSFNVIKDTTPPATNSTINAITTANTSPALSGNLPNGNDDNDTSAYTVSIEINGTKYDATNNEDRTWSLAEGVIAQLNEGIYSVIIEVTDEAGNSSSTTLVNKIEINHTGFLIDSAVEGIKYISGKYSGYTDINGLFKYDYGEGVTFYIGDDGTGIPMGTAQVKQDPYNSKRQIITLFDLESTTDENNSRVANMGRFLQTLDADGDVSNGITIDKVTKDSIALLGLKNLDFSADAQTFENNEKLQELFEDLSTHFGGHVRLLSDEEAKAHLVAVRDNKEATKVLTEVTKVRGEKETIQVLTGVFKTTTGVVEGLDYRCGNQSGRTNEKGEFKYEDGKKIKFAIAELNFGTTNADVVISPANLVPSTSFNHPRPRNIVRLLSVFDSDGNNANGITIDKAVREALDKYRFQIDLNLQDGKANSELNIPAGVDEFGSQFEEFEMGSEILNEITTLRAGV